MWCPNINQDIHVPEIGDKIKCSQAQAANQKLPLHVQNHMWNYGGLMVTEVIQYSPRYYAVKIEEAPELTIWEWCELFKYTPR